MAAKITPDGLWRVTYGDTWGLSTEEYLERQPMRYEQLLPGNPKPGEYKLVNASPYKLHQRCASSFRVGRFLLAADAAHLCNPLYVPHTTPQFQVLLTFLIVAEWDSLAALRIQRAFMIV